MNSPVIQMSAAAMTTWEGFHEAFANTLGFPDYYGKNMNAWIDCMTCLDDDTPQSEVVVEPGEVLVIQVSEAGALKESAPEIWSALNECAAFVNYRRIEKGEPPVLALSYYV